MGGVVMVLWLRDHFLTHPPLPNPHHPCLPFKVYGSKVAAMEETGITEARWDHVCVAVASLDDGVLPYIERDLCGRGTFIREFRRPGFFSGSTSPAAWGVGLWFRHSANQ